MKTRGLIIGFCIALLIFISACSTQNNYTIVENSVHWENAYGRIEVTPHTCSNIHCVHNAEIEVYLPSQDFDFAFKFDEILINPKLFEWSDTLNAYQVFNNNTQQIETRYHGGWIDRTQVFTMDIYDGKVYYWVSGVAFTQYETKKYRWEYDNPGGDGKWELLAKRTSETLVSAIENENYIILDPWYQDPTLSTGITHHYDFDTNNNFLDLVGSSDGTFNGSPTPVFKTGLGICNGAYDFGTGTGYFDFTEELVDESADFSISVWVYYPDGSLSGTTSYDYVFSQRDAAGNFGFGFGIGVSNATFIAHENVRTITGTITLSEETWYHLVYVYDLGGTPQNSFYINEVRDTYDAAENGSTIASGTTTRINIGIKNDGQADGNWTGYIDEFATWNRTLTLIEIDELYNNGSGVGAGAAGIQVINQTITPSPAYTNSTLNCSGFVNDTVSSNNLNVNLTSYKNSVVYDIATLSNIASASYIWNTSIFPSSLVSGDQWYCVIYAEDVGDSSRSDTETSTTRTITSLPPSIPTTIAPANFSVYYGSPTLTCSGSVDPEGDVINYTFAESDNTLLQNTQSTTYNWTGLALGTEDDWKCRACDNNSQCSAYISLRNISRINLTNCTSGNIALNLSFVNESDSANMKGVLDSLTITTNTLDSYNYTGSQPTANKSFVYCLNPVDTNVNGITSVSYSATNFPQRNFYFTEDYNGNTSILRKLYLLHEDDGIYTTFQVVTTGNQPIEDVTVGGEVLISGTYTNISGGLTDAAGSITFWVDPDTSHRFTFTKTGYAVYTTTITPTQSSYTVTLGGETETNETNYNRGILFDILPKDPVLNNHTQYTFGFNISSSFWNLTSYGFNLVDENGSVLATQTGTDTLGSYVSQAYNTTTLTEIDMDYFWEVDGLFMNGSHSWKIITTYEGSFSLMNFFDDLKAFSDAGEAGMDKFALGLISFVIILLIIAFVSYKGGITAPLAIGGLLVALVGLFSFVGLIPAVNNQKYFITIIMLLLWGGLVIRENIR